MPDLDGALRSRLARLARAGSEPESSINGSMPTAYWKPCKCVRPKKPRFARLLQSPLPDSNRRPPPYMEVQRSGVGWSGVAGGGFAPSVRARVPGYTHARCGLRFSGVWALSGHRCSGRLLTRPSLSARQSPALSDSTAVLANTSRPRWVGGRADRGRRSVGRAQPCARRTREGARAST
jgi:hypothetical protein